LIWAERDWAHMFQKPLRYLYVMAWKLHRFERATSGVLYENEKGEVRLGFIFPDGKIPGIYVREANVVFVPLRQWITFCAKRNYKFLGFAYAIKDYMLPCRFFFPRHDISYATGKYLIEHHGYPGDMLNECGLIRYFSSGFSGEEFLEFYEERARQLKPETIEEIRRSVNKARTFINMIYAKHGSKIRITDEDHIYIAYVPNTKWGVIWKLSGKKEAAEFYETLQQKFIMWRIKTESALGRRLTWHELLRGYLELRNKMFEEKLKKNPNFRDIIDVSRFLLGGKRFI